ncbi:MAG: WbqC family protein [Carbonactinosporaceae bacterium]
MRVAIHQPHYLPWLGYVDKIDRAELFICLDSVQFERKGWQNRNYIKTPNGPAMLTIPAARRDHRPLICDQVVDESRPWREKHRRTIESSYRNAPHWATHAAKLLAVYDMAAEHLVEYAVESTRAVLRGFGVTTPCVRASRLGEVSGAKTALVAELAARVGATTLVSGEGCRRYLDVELLERHGVTVEWQSFVHPVYPQIHLRPGFVPRLAAFDLLANVGPDSLGLLRETQRTARPAPVPEVH